MTSATKMEWESIINQNIYIYGAAKTAINLHSFIINQGYKSIKGFLVTDKRNNPTQLLNLPVIDIHMFEDKEANILVPHLGTYKEQISHLLKSLDFVNVYLVGQLMTKTLWEEKRIIRETGRTKSGVNQKRLNKDKEIRKYILKLLKDSSPDFGGVVPYQSMEMIGLEGMRPTEYRIQEYCLKEILKPKDNVLDIGCNLGFLDMSIADCVHSVTGIEYDKNLVKVGELVRDYLNITNCSFYNGDFNNWCRQTSMTYNVIFSFAIHHWLNLSPQKYVEILDKLTQKKGYICFESHIYGTDDKFNECCKRFQELAYKVICDKKINDSGLQEREYILLQKDYG